MSYFAAAPKNGAHFVSWSRPIYQQYDTTTVHPLLSVQPDSPCHFLKLPTELRQEIFKYLMPERPIKQRLCVPPTIEPQKLYGEDGSLDSTRAISLLNGLLGFNREIYHEFKDVLHATATFVIRIDRDGVMFCGRRILSQMGPVGHDGGVYLYHGDDERDIGRFIQQFPWTKIRNYHIDLVFGRDVDPRSHTLRPQSDWQVERYDIRDYVAVVVSGILSKCRRLNKLQVRAKYLDARPRTEDALADIELLVEPFKRLRCVRRPLLIGVFQHEAFVNRYCRHRQPHNHCLNNCIPPLPADPVPIIAPGISGFDDLATPWEQTLALEAPTNMIPASPLTKLFIEFKEFHNKVTVAMPHVVRVGRQCFLHRARVAREHEDIAQFRSVVAQLMAAWRHHVQLQDAQRYEVHRAVWRMMDADTYPGGRGAALQAVVENSAAPIKEWRLRTTKLEQQ